MRNKEIIKNIITKIMGSEKDFLLEHRFLNITVLIGMLIAFSSTVLNIIIGLHISIILIKFFTGVMLFLLYYHSINKNKHMKLVYTSLLMLSLLIYPLLFIYKSGSSGIIPIVIVFHSSMLAIILSKYKYKIFIAIHFISIIIIFVVEYFYPDVIVGYETKIARLIDVGVTLIVISAFTFILNLMIIKQYNSSLNKVNNMHKELIDKNKELKRISITDELTGIYNRRFIIERLNDALDNRNSTKILSVIMFDIDDFKGINDNYGHLAGDKVIKKVCNIIISNIRQEDILGRIGGEEFIILIPNVNGIKAKEKAEKLRLLIEQFEWENNMNVTVSGGIYIKEKNDSTNAILHKVDLCLYKAKANGKNNVQCYKDVKESL